MKVTNVALIFCDWWQLISFSTQRLTCTDDQKPEEHQNHGRTRFLMFHINLITEISSVEQLKWFKAVSATTPSDWGGGRNVDLNINLDRYHERVEGLRMDYRWASFKRVGDWIDMKTLPGSKQCTQVRNSCSLMHSGSVYPITALIKPQCFPSDLIKVLHQAVMGSVLTVSSARFTQQQHDFMFPYRPIREAQEVGFCCGHQSEIFCVFVSIWSMQ